jgi:hypothetical protein
VLVKSFMPMTLKLVHRSWLNIQSVVSDSSFQYI